MNYCDVETWIMKLDNVRTEVIGRSVFGKRIFCIECGEGEPVLIQYGIHGREWITVCLAMKHLDLFLKEKHNFKLCMICCLNPDGMDLALSGNDLWKANGRGVDLNNNFDAGWSLHSHSLFPTSHGYCGVCPESEPETKAICKLTSKIKPKLTLSFHCKGEEIYYQYYQKGDALIRDRKIAKMFADSFGYRIVNTEKYSSGGFKDWCIEKLSIPSLTIEVGSDRLTHPIGIYHLRSIYEQTKNVFNIIDKVMEKLI